MNLRHSLWLVLVAVVVPPSAGHATQPAVNLKLDGLAVVAEPVMSKNCQFLRLYLENTTAKPLAIEDHYSPAFTVDTWFQFKADGVVLDQMIRGVHSHFPGSDEKKVLPPNTKTYIGAVVLRKFVPQGYSSYTPLLNLKPGKHALEITAKQGIKPAKLEVTVPAKPTPNVVPGGFPEPDLVLALTQAKHERNAQFILIQVLNRSDKKIQIQHDGLEPPWHTEPWFDLEVNGKPYKPKVPPIAVKEEKGIMTIDPLENRYRGELMIPLAGMDKKFFDHNNYYTPVLALAPGKYTIRVIPSQRWFQPGITPPLPASIEVIVPDAKKPKKQ